MWLKYLSVNNPEDRNSGGCGSNIISQLRTLKIEILVCMAKISQLSTLKIEILEGVAQRSQLSALKIEILGCMAQISFSK